jgi:hypothetical protein
MTRQHTSGSMSVPLKKSHPFSRPNTRMNTTPTSTIAAVA